MGPALVVASTLAVVFLWCVQRPPGIPDARFIGEVLGVEAVLLFTWTLVLMALLSPVQRLFGGLDAMTVAHRRTAVVGLGVIVLHWLLVITSRDPDDRSTGNLLGTIALWGLVLFILWAILPTLVRWRIRFPHWLRTISQRGFQTWVSWHRLIGLFVLAAMLHGILVDQVLREAPVALAVYLVICAVGVGAYAYRELWLSRHLRSYDYAVSAVAHLNGSVTEVTLNPIGRSLEFTPGQFVFVGFSSLDGGQKHPFTLSGGVEESSLRVSIADAGDFTDAVYHRLAAGAGARIVGPFGNFDYREGGRRQVWVAGGIGITPFISWIRSFPRSLDFDIDFYYTVRTAGDELFADEILRAAEQHSGFRAHLHASDRQGELTVAEMTAGLASPRDGWAYMCGPLGMVTAMSAGFRKAGLKSSHVVWEHFTSIR